MTFHQDLKRYLKNKLEGDLESQAKILNAHLTEGEKWFHGRWREAGMLLHPKVMDTYNEPIFRCIPRVLNKEFKYIIELDQYRKVKREVVMANNGYHIFRVTTHSEEDFARLVAEVRAYRIKFLMAKYFIDRAKAENALLRMKMPILE